LKNLQEQFKQTENDIKDSHNSIQLPERIEQSRQLFAQQIEESQSQIKYYAAIYANNVQFER